MKIDKNLKNYIEKEIFKVYKNNECNLVNHINYVIRRSLDFALNISDANINMVYVIAAFHDIGYHINKESHEIISADLFYNDEKMREFFNEEEMITIKEAILDHRPKETSPRSIYGKIIRTADRETSINDTLKRTYKYALKNYPSMTKLDMINKVHNHLLKKYGNIEAGDGYIKDLEYEQFINAFKRLLNDKDKFIKMYFEVNDINNNLN